MKNTTYRYGKTTLPSFYRKYPLLLLLRARTKFLEFEGLFEKEIKAINMAIRLYY